MLKILERMESSTHYKETAVFSVRNQDTRGEIARPMRNGKRRITTGCQEMGQENAKGQEMGQETTTGNPSPVTTVGKLVIFHENAEEKGGTKAEEIEKADRWWSWRSSERK